LRGRALDVTHPRPLSPSSSSRSGVSCSEPRIRVPTGAASYGCATSNVVTKTSPWYLLEFLRICGLEEELHRLVE
jgi:hypothetical protein